MAGLPGIEFLVPLIHREIHDPTELPLALLDEVELLAQVETHLTKSICGLLEFLCREEQEIAVFCLRLLDELLLQRLCEVFGDIAVELCARDLHIGKTCELVEFCDLNQ